MGIAKVLVATLAIASTLVARAETIRVPSDSPRIEGSLWLAADDLVFVPNVTAAVNAVIRSLPLAPGDELLTTSPPSF